MTPIELITHAKKAGLAGISITDHDTISAYSAETLAHAEKEGMRLKTGVEFSCRHLETSVHVLAYSLDLSNSDLTTLCSDHQGRRHERNLVILEKLTKGNMPVSIEELPKEGVVGRPHIARVLVEKGFAFSVEDAFRRYLGDKKKYNHPGPSFSVEDTLEVIHAAGGKAFIAHPILLNNRKCLNSLLNLPFDGIECYYARFGLKEEQPYLEMAHDHKLLISGGSDFHGSMKPDTPIGSSWVSEEHFDAI